MLTHEELVEKALSRPGVKAAYRPMTKRPWKIWRAISDGHRSTSLSQPHRKPLLFDAKYPLTYGNSFVIRNNVPYYGTISVSRRSVIVHTIGKRPKLSKTKEGANEKGAIRNHHDVCVGDPRDAGIRGDGAQVRHYP
jgi:hypothetical protein